MISPRRFHRINLGVIRRIGVVDESDHVRHSVHCERDGLVRVIDDLATLRGQTDVDQEVELVVSYTHFAMHFDVFDLAAWENRCVQDCDLAKTDVRAARNLVHRRRDDVLCQTYPFRYECHGLSFPVAGFCVNTNTIWVVCKDLEKSAV